MPCGAGRKLSVVITDMTSAEAVPELRGPRSRERLAPVSPDDVSNAANPFGTVQRTEPGMGSARARRVP